MEKLKGHLLVAELKKKGSINKKVGVTVKMDAETMQQLYTQRKDKELSEKDFYLKIFANQMKPFMEKDYFIDIFYEEDELD